MSLRSIFESIWNYDFSHWLVYSVIIFGILLNLILILRLAANIFKFKEIKKDFLFYVEILGIVFVLSFEIFIAFYYFQNKLDLSVI
jgi:hypothetical protein